MSTIAKLLSISKVQPFLAELRLIIDQQPTYGYRQVVALLNKRMGSNPPSA